MNFSSQVSIAVILIFSQLTGYYNAHAQAQDESDSGRFSIAIRGGASKGAYEAGLNWSVIKLSREISDSEMLEGGRTFQLELESITGASAGGINTLLSGLTWCSRPEKEGGIHNRIDNNVFRDIWLRADIRTLLPRYADSADYLHDDAVLSRKDFLEAAGNVRDLWNKPHYRKFCRIPLGVTVTRIEPDKLTVGSVDVQNQRFYIPFELRVMADNSIDFFFDPADYPKLADPAMILMPWSIDKVAFSIDDKSIEDVLFTTSAYPMAFGRKRLQYCRLITHENNDELEPQRQTAVKMDKDLRCAEGYALAEAEFSDGGLFDNLPIGLARILAERNISAKDNIYPVTYVYLDPNRTRYKIPQTKTDLACDSFNPPEACRTMTFNLASEGALLLNAMGTARTYELYRELTGDNWQLNMSEISYKLSRMLSQRASTNDCEKELPYFDRSLNCAEALNRAGHLLEIAYDRTRPVIEEPYSVKRLRDKGIVTDCTDTTVTIDSSVRTECVFDIIRYRNQLADAMRSIVEQESLEKNKVYSDIEKSRYSLHHDRALRVSSRSVPITGTLLESFGSFFDYKFREYDYYVGVYDAVILSAKNFCGLRYSSNYQPEKYRECFDSASKIFYDILDFSNDARGRYVFARLAQHEYGRERLLQFSYEPMPADDRDMRTIHYGLAAALEEGESAKTFFEYLKAEDFTPTPAEDGKPTMLSKIIDDPDSWASELTRRITNRLVYLETEAEEIYEAREPDSEERKSANTELIGAASYVLQSATYRDPEFTFSPSTAPDNWVWRNFIPFEMGFDLVEGDMIFAWQPTVALTKKDMLGLRVSLGFTGGLFTSSKDVTRENYLGLGVSYTRKTSYLIASSFGVAPTWFHNLSEPEVGKQNTLGGDVFINLLKDRLRVGLGVRDFNESSDTVFLTLSVNDIPGMVYWLTR